MMKPRNLFYPVALLTAIAGCAGLLVLAMASPPASSASPLLHLPQADNPISPTVPVKLIFIHHSTGENWLNDSDGGLGIALRNANYFVSDTNYGWGPDDADAGFDTIGDHTDIGHWYNWFVGPNAITYTTALYAEYDQTFSYSRLETDPGGPNGIIMFKSCYPNSHIGGNPGDPPTVGANPLRGQDAYSEYHTVANIKGIYNDLLTYFANHQEKLFIVIIAPPLQEGDTDAAHAANARAVSDWLMNDWLDSYAHNNVAVFDFYNILTSNGGTTRTDDPDTNDLGWADGNHHRWIEASVQHTQTVANNYSAYWGGNGGGSHPSTAGNLKATAEFVPLLNVFYNRWQGGETPCTGITDVGVIGGTDSGYTDIPYIFTGVITPSNASTPITYTWTPAPDSGQGTASATYTWATPGIQTVSLLAENCGGSDSFTRTITIETASACAHPLEAAGITGPTSGYTDTQYTFTAVLTPSNASAPITYTWEPAPDSGQGNATVHYNWAITGTKTITLTAENCGGNDTATRDISIVQRPVASHFIYLPLVLRQYTASPPTCAAPLTVVTINGPNLGMTNTLYTFTAAPTPANATTPIAYTWTPAPASGQGTASATYQWATTGSKTISVAASNCAAAHTANDDHTITIQGQTPQPGGALIYPTDFTYLGAFRLPDESSGDISWSYGGAGMTYYPHGDPTSADAYPGSLFSISDYPFNNYVAEVSIPVPVISADKDLADLPTATTLQPFTDVTGGRQITGLQDSLTVVDVQYYPQQGTQTSAKLYWVMFEYYMPEDEIGHGWSELDFSHLQSQGTWQLGDFPTSGANKYLFEIPTAWADTYTPGKYLAAGRSRVPNNGTWGPALYAFGPWNDGNPPANGSSVAATQMLYYPFDDDNSYINHLVRDFSNSDDWLDGAWLTSGERSAVVFAGMKALRRAYDLEYYGDYNVDGCGYKGWHAEPYYAALMFYDPALLAAAVQGEIAPYEVQPYAMLNVDDYMFQQGCRRQTLGGVGYDRERGLVYVLEKEVMADEGKPIVHVFQLSATPQSADFTPPAAPPNVQATPSATHIDLTWDAAADNTHLAGYILYRFGEPIATTPATTYSDDKVNPGTTYTYTIVAWDASHNLSAPAVVVANTPAGADDRMPIIYDIEYSGLANTGITVRWLTDEPATTVLTYEVQYSGNLQVYQNATLTRRHKAVLTGLTPETSYFVWEVVSADAAGHTNIFHLENWEFYTAPAGETLNFRPVLNGIGSRRVTLGATVAFTLEAFDRDSDDALTFSATGLPAGATLHPTTGQFSWTPAAAGTTRITFTVSDGDQTDSERVTLFVTASGR